MKILWTDPHHNLNQTGLPNLPEKIRINFENKILTLTKVQLDICIEFLKRDFGVQGNEVFVHSLFSEDGLFGFAIIVDIKNKTIYIPPGGITNKNFKGGGGKLQNLFEQIATKNGYKLCVCIAAHRISGFSQRVVDILRKEGYFLGTPNDTHAYGVHQSTYQYNGIPKLGIPNNEMLQPISMY